MNFCCWPGARHRGVCRAAAAPRAPGTRTPGPLNLRPPGTARNRPTITPRPSCFLWSVTLTCISVVVNYRRGATDDRGAVCGVCCRGDSRPAVDNNILQGDYLEEY